MSLILGLKLRVGSEDIHCGDIRDASNKCENSKWSMTWSIGCGQDSGLRSSGQRMESPEAWCHGSLPNSEF